MTKNYLQKLRLTKKGFKVENLDPVQKTLHHILRIFKKRETPFLPIFYLNEKLSQINPVRSLVKVEKNLFAGKYEERLWTFVKDVNEAFDYVQCQHTKKAKMHSFVIECRGIFNSQMDFLMQELGFCCGTWYTLKPRKIACNGNKVRGCEIQSMSLYYRYKDWTYCDVCFDNFNADLITLDEENIVSKSQFSEHFFGSEQPESFVRCAICNQKNHDICVTYFRLSGLPFHCERCRQREHIEKIPLRAKLLPRTNCDIFIENFLKRNNINANSLTIRQFSSVNKSLNVKKAVQDFRTGAQTYNYQNCTLFTFYEADHDSDICFYAIYFQLYGSECIGPNQSTVYVSYIDSVNLFPSPNRTLIYRTILLGLFEFLKTQGFQRVFLWSCPPRQNQDYIFYMKPPKMRMPSKERLSKWYVDMFELGKEMGVIGSYHGIHEHSIAENWKSVSDVPYMDGDLWIIRTEEAVEGVNKELSKLQKQVLSLNKRISQEKLKAKSETRKFKELKTKFAKSMKELRTFDMNATLWKAITMQIRGFNKEYFIIHLTEPSSESVHDVTIFDTIDRFWVDCRSDLVDFLWENSLEFSSERRARFSTHVMLYRIFLEDRLCVQCLQVSENGVTGDLLCENCHNVRLKSYYQAAVIPKMYSELDLQPKVVLNRLQQEFIANACRPDKPLKVEPDIESFSRETSSLGMSSKVSLKHEMPIKCNDSSDSSDSSQDFLTFLRTMPQRSCRTSQQWTVNRVSHSFAQKILEKRKIIDTISIDEDMEE